MFLSLRRLKLRNRDEDGSGLVLVIAVMAVMIVLALLVAGMTTQALGYTSSTRAGVQSLAAAEAGADYAAAQLSTGASCQSSYSNPATVGAPVFTASVQYSVSATGSSWVNCPFGGAAAARIKIVSQGFATSKGTAGQKAGDSRKVEAIYKYIPAVSIPATGSAVYSYNNGTFNSMDVLSPSLDADVMVKTGDFHCTTSGSKVQGSVLVAAGAATLDNACEVTGNLWSAGIITLGDGKVGGNALSASTGTSSFSPSSRVGGFLDLGGPATTWASRCSSPYDNWDESGNRCAIQQSIVAGSVTFRDPTVQAPVVPEWLDYGFTASDWTGAGFQILSWPAACNVDNTVMDTTWFKTTFLNLTTPTVFDTRAACPNGIIFVSGSLSWAMKTDIAFIENKVDIQGLTVTSSNSAQARRLWFITPDSNLTDHQPNCTGQARDSGVNTSTVITAPVVAMVYTPCKMSNSANTWRGQIYGGVVDFNSANGLTYIPVGLAGANLAAGGPVGVSGGALGTEISSRDLDG